MAGLIERLPEDVAAQIKSSASISSLNTVIEGLVRNSLDASASKVEIDVDYKLGSCTVQDNGVGICPYDFREDGKLGKPYCTSKLNRSRQIHGQQGLFLASLNSLAFVKITSKHEEYRSENTIIFHRGKTVARFLPSTQEHEFHFSQHGTLVVVRDLFGNFPVRVKQRVIQSENGGGLERPWRELEQVLFALLLAWPFPFRFIVRNTQTGQRFVYQSQSTIRTLDSDSGEASSPLEKFRSLLRQAKYVERSEETWQVLRGSTSSLEVEGTISLLPWPTRKLQFLSLGINPITSSRIGGNLYDEINDVFSNSNFSLEPENESLVSKSTKPSDRRVKLDSKGNTLKSRNRGADRWPAFFIRIEFKENSTSLDISNDFFQLNAGSLNKISSAIREMLNIFLLENHFKPGKNKWSQGSADFGPTKPSLRKLPLKRALKTNEHPKTPPLGKIGIDNPLGRTTQPAEKGRSLVDFQNWSRIKSGSDSFFQNNFHHLDGLKSSKKPEEDISPSDESNSNDKSLPDITGSSALEITEWTDDIRKQSYRFNARTGQAYIADGIPNTNVPDVEIRRSLPVRSGPPKTSTPIEAKSRVQDNNKRSGWLDEVLETWKNPVFEPTEISIPQIPGALTAFDFTSHQGCADSHGEDHFKSIEQTVVRKFTKEALEDADIIAQVDQKFILATFPISGNSSSHSTFTLGLVDQHAADERCIIEDLYASLISESEPIIHNFDASKTVTCRIAIFYFEKPIVLEIDSKEKDLFKTHAQHFAGWGFLLTLNPKDSTQSKQPTINVKTAPESIAERCRTKPKILIELLRTELWRVHERGHGPLLRSLPANPHHSPDWIRKIADCPPGIINLLNSRACRSAIMFNDHLTKSECEGLLRRLSKCAFPFTCAHGRPSMVPIGDLGDAVTKHRLGPSTLDRSRASSGTSSSKDLWSEYSRSETD